MYANFYWFTLLKKMTIGETMSNDTIKLGFELNDTGDSVSKNIKNVDTLRKAVDGVSAAASKASVGKKMAAAYAGSTTDAIKSASMSPQESVQYGQARAAVGTGAAGRDFAKQAQGLGGLVHVYATFAANLFAAEAAFRALSKAADTTNLVSGLDQLGAAAGRSLGSLSKQMVAATDGALSLRDAMTSTALASSAGMTNANILRMTEVARKASLALGRDMPDSMDRLTRGIAKIEPELLDELGIMARVIPSQEAYARQIGKSVSALTDFEKRQAFANAVLEEGEKKFNAIKLDSNPYSKILASMQNIAHVGLELVNKVFSPILGVLSESPMALATTMTAIAGILLKQAIPAIGQFRENAKLMAKETHERLKTQLKEQQEYAIRSDAIVQEAAEKEYLTSAKAAKKVEELQSARYNKQVLGSKVRGLLTKSPFELTDEEANVINKKHYDLAEKIQKNEASAAEKLQLAKLEARAKDIEAIREHAKDAGLAAAQANEQSDEKWYAHQALMRKKQQAMERAEAKAHILSMAADNAAIYGPTYAFSALVKDVGGMKGGILTKSITGIQGAASIATTAIGNLMNVYGMYVAAAVAASALLDHWFSTNTKQAEEFAKATDALSVAADNASRTINAMGAKDPFAALDVDSMQARATALNELSSSVTAASAKFVELQKTSGGWDSFKDSLFDAFGSGSADVLSTSLAKAVTSGIRLMQEGPAKQAAKAKLNNIIGNSVDVTSFKDVEKALRNLSNSDVADKGKVITDFLAGISREANNASSVLTDLKGSFESTTKVVQTAIAELSPKDVFAKTGASLITDSMKVAEAIKTGPIEALDALNLLLKSNEVMSLLPRNTVSQLQDAKKEIDSITEKLGGNEKARIKAEEDIAALKLKNKYKQLSSDAGGNTIELLSDEADRLEETLVQLNASRAALTESAKKTASAFADLDKEIFKAGVDKLTISLKGAFEEGGIAAAKGYLNVLKGVGGETAAREGELRARDIAIQMENVKATYSHITAIQENTRALTEKTAKDDLLEVARVLNSYQEKGQVPSQSVMDSLMARQLEATSKLKVIGEERRLTGEGSKGVKSALDLQKNAPGAMADETKQALKNIAPIIAQMFAMEGQLAKLVGAAAADKLQTMASVITESATTTKRSLDQATAQNTIELDSLNNAISLSSAYNEVLYTKKNELEIANQLNTYLGEYAAINAKVLITDKLIEEVSKGRTQAQLSTNKDYLSAVEAKKKAEKDLDTLVTSNVLKLGRLQAKQALDQMTAEQTGVNARLDAYRTLGGISEKEYINAKLKLENDKEDLRTALAIADIKSNVTAVAESKITSAQVELKGANVPTDRARELNALIAEQQSLIKGVEDGTNSAIVKATEQLDTQKQLNTAIADQKIALDSVKLATESLAAVFGTLGTSIGGVLGGIAQYTTSSNAMALAHAKNMEGLVKGSDKYKDQEKKNADSRTAFEVRSIATIAGATKKLFNEKSGAYKAFAAVEKTAHLVSIGLEAKKLGIMLSSYATEISANATKELVKTGQTEAGFFARLPTYISEIWASWGAMGPWMAAAAGVFIATKLGGGGSRESYSGPTGEEFQKAQGTGQAYDASGNLMDTGLGVFGDSSQKLDSINKSLEILNDTAVKGLDYDNKMLKALNMVAEAITGAATQLYSVPGLRQGTNFGTLGGSTSIAAGGLSGALDSILGGLTGGMLGGVGSAIFGGGTSVTASVDAAGLQLRGTFENVMNDIAGSITQYKDILKQFEEDGGWFGSDSSWTERYRETQAVSGQISGAIADIFFNAKDMFKTVGELSGVTAAQVDYAFKNMSLNTEINLKGLTGDEVLTELNAVISVELNRLTNSLFGAFDRFKKFGEDLLTTVVRVIDTNTKITQVMKNLGTIGNLQGAFDITEVLAKAAGGLDKFIEQANYFNENFYTTAEQVIPTQKAVIKQLDALGLSSVTTKAQLKSVVQGLDLTTDSGRNTYQAIMDLAPGFMEVTDAITEQSTALSDAATNFREFAKTISNFRDSLLLSASSTATPLEKYAEAKIQFESTYTAALGGDKDAMSKLTGISQTFLDMSKQFYASSDQYTTDFNTVLDKLEFASLNASASADVAQLQLDNLSIHTTLLTSINANIATLAGVPAAANGGRVSGLTLVGEYGPELVDFVTPGQVYTADQTAGMFAGNNGMGQAIGAVVGELQQLRAEVTQLRKDQQKQTGDLIISNYDANNKASEAITAAVVDASQEQAWTARSQSQIK